MQRRQKSWKRRKSPPNVRFELSVLHTKGANISSGYWKESKTQALITAATTVATVCAGQKASVATHLGIQAASALIPVLFDHFSQSVGPTESPNDGSTESNSTTITGPVRRLMESLATLDNLLDNGPEEYGKVNWPTLMECSVGESPKMVSIASQLRLDVERLEVTFSGFAEVARNACEQVDDVSQMLPLQYPVQSCAKIMPQIKNDMEEVRRSSSQSMKENIKQDVAERRMDWKSRIQAIQTTFNDEIEQAETRRVGPILDKK